MPTPLVLVADVPAALARELARVALDNKRLTDRYQAARAAFLEQHPEAAATPKPLRRSA